MSQDKAPSRRKNHALWLGPLVTAIAAVSYFTIFARFPALRDFPWVNLPLVIAGAAISVVGLRRAFGRAGVYRGKILGALGGTFSLGLAILFCGYVFVLSYSLPDPTSATLALEIVPELGLETHTGDRLELGDLRGRKAVITFYRGFW